MYEKILKCLNDIRKITDFKPRVAIVLGSGLGSLADEIRIVETVNYRDIEGFPVSTVKGHKGRFVFGFIENTPVVIMQGRVHFYEGYSIYDVVLPIRIMRLLGAEKLILTNAAGGINEEFSPGDLMVICDHISSFVPSPLIGENIDELGIRFPDMSQVYDKSFIEKICNISEKINIPVKKGTYIQLSGPNYETPAEIRMCRVLGADAVGMSTACEAAAAVHAGFKVCGISCITNMAAGISKQPLAHKEVETVANKISVNFKTLIKKIVVSI